MKTAVIALGGNAILRANQRGGIADIYENIRSTAIHLTDLIVDGYDIVLAHEMVHRWAGCLYRVRWQGISIHLFHWMSALPRVKVRLGIFYQAHLIMK